MPPASLATLPPLDGPVEILSPRLTGEALSAAQWARLLDVTKKAFTLRGVPSAGVVPGAGGQLTRTYKFGDLPADYRQTLDELRRRQACGGFGDLLSVRQAETDRWQPDRELGTLPPGSQVLAQRRKDVLAVFWQALERGRNAGQANSDTRAAWLSAFGGEACNEKTIRRWVAAIEARGGPDLAPLEAYAGLKSGHGKSVPHAAARRETRLGIPPELIAALRAASVQPGMEHLRGAWRAVVELPWLQHLPVPGVGFRPQPGAEFPFTFAQLRPFFPSTAARRLGTHGWARAKREALVHGTNTTGSLRRMERVLLDDSRVNIIARDERTQMPVELRCQFLLDVGCRRIEGFVLREAGNMRATDTDALLSRVLRTTGIAGENAGYATTIRFERGAVACSPARGKVLLDSFPGRLFFDRTGMDGGRAYAGAPVQSASGRWMEKSHVESFMRTLAFFVQHIPGQRGGVYARQPAALGLTGRSRKTGALEYTAGSQMHEAALLSAANQALAVLGVGDDVEGTVSRWAEQGGAYGPAPETLPGGRLKISALYPVRWILDALKLFTAYYNQRTDHRLEGFRRVETQCPQTGKWRERRESPDERAAFLNGLSPTERISDADAASLLLRPRPVTITRQGVTLSVAPYERLRFWREDSKVCAQAGLLTTGEKKMIALLDEDSVLHACGADGLSYRPELYLIGNTQAELDAGLPVRLVDTLPLYDLPALNDPAALARQNEAKQREVNRYAAELVRAVEPILVQQAAELQHNHDRLRAVVTADDGAARATLASSPLLRALAAARAGDGLEIEPADGDGDLPTRHQQQQSAEDSYAARLAARMAAEAEA